MKKIKIILVIIIAILKLSYVKSSYSSSEELNQMLKELERINLYLESKKRKTPSKTLTPATAKPAQLLRGQENYLPKRVKAKRKPSAKQLYDDKALMDLTDDITPNIMDLSEDTARYIDSPIDAYKPRKLLRLSAEAPDKNELNLTEEEAKQKEESKEKDQEIKARRKKDRQPRHFTFSEAHILQSKLCTLGRTKKR